VLLLYPTIIKLGKICKHALGLWLLLRFRKEVLLLKEHPCIHISSQREVEGQALLVPLGRGSFKGHNIAL
jgi:hypothetical protein